MSVVFFFGKKSHYLWLCCDLQNGRLKVIELLFDKGADVNGADNEAATPLWVASQVRFFLLQN